jgi:hypothetical protein
MKTAVRAEGDVSFKGLGNCAADTLALAQSGHEFGPGEETRSSSNAVALVAMGGAPAFTRGCRINHSECPCINWSWDTTIPVRVKTPK